MGSGWISVKEADARRCFSVQILDLILDYFYESGLISSDWPFLTTLSFLVWVKLSLTAITVTESHKVHKSCVFKSVLVDGYAQSWSQGIFWTVELTKACCFVFSNWKKSATKGFKIEKASRKLHDKNFKILVYLRVIFRFMCECKNDEKKQQIGSIWTLPGSKLDQEIGKRR